MKDWDYDQYDQEDIENEYLTPKEVMNLLYIGKILFTDWYTLENCLLYESENSGVSKEKHY